MIHDEEGSVKVVVAKSNQSQHGILAAFCLESRWSNCEIGYVLKTVFNKKK